MKSKIIIASLAGAVLLLVGMTLGSSKSPNKNLAGTLIQGQYTATAPTLSNGTMDGLRIDQNANLKVTLATLIGGENQVLDRMTVTGLNTCIATTTDSIVATGAGVLNNFWVADHGASSGAVFRNALSGAGTTTIIAEDTGYPATATGVGAFRMPGAIFTTGLHVDIVGTATTTVCYVQ